MGSNRQTVHELLLAAFAEGDSKGFHTQDCMKALRALSEKEQGQIGMPYGASDLELFEYIMKTGGFVLLIEEK